MAREFGDLELDYIQQVFESKRLGARGHGVAYRREGLFLCWSW